MARYFFNIENADIRDTDGYEFASMAEAKCEAVRYAASLICDSVSTFWDSGDLNLVVTNERGLVLFSLRMFGTEAPAIRDLR